MSSQSEATLADSAAAETLPPPPTPRLLNLPPGHSGGSAGARPQLPVRCRRRHGAHQPVMAADNSDHRFHGRGAARTIGSAAECKHRTGPGWNIHGDYTRLAVRGGDESRR